MLGIGIWALSEKGTRHILALARLDTKRCQPSLFFDCEGGVSLRASFRRVLPSLHTTNTYHTVSFFGLSDCCCLCCWDGEFTDFFAKGSAAGQWVCRREHGKVTLDSAATGRESKFKQRREVLPSSYNSSWWRCSHALHEQSRQTITKRRH